MSRNLFDLLGVTDADVEHPLPNAWAVLKSSWKLTRINLVTFGYLILVPITTLVIAVTFAHTQTSTTAHGALFSLGWLILVVTFILTAITVPALSYTRLESVRKQHVTYIDALKKGVSLFLRWWLLEALMVFMVAGGLILIVFPGLYLLRRYVLARYVLVDRNVGVMEALHESARISRPYNGAMWSTVTLLALSPIAFVLLPGAIGLLVLLVMFVWNMCGTALRYNQIVRKETKALAPKEKKHPKKAKATQRTKKKS
jgi:uncharacterized membrane protein